MNFHFFFSRSFILLSIFLSACSSIFAPSSFNVEKSIAQSLNRNCDFSNIHLVHPKKEVRSKLGNPSSYEVYGKIYKPMKTLNKNYHEVGLASWYGPNFASKKTSSGELFNSCELTAAHRTVPIPSYFLVKNLENGKKVVVRVNDRGPFVKTDERIIDLSYMAAYLLGFSAKGTAKVEIQSLSEYQYSEKVWVVQIGSFTSKQSAEKIKKRIESIGQISDKTSIILDNNRFKLYILAKNQTTEQLGKILKNNKIKYFVTSINKYLTD